MNLVYELSKDTLPSAGRARFRFGKKCREFIFFWVYNKKESEAILG